jgi:transcriptional regulator with PAS, ATPase and Fis domain
MSRDRRDPTLALPADQVIGGAVLVIAPGTPNERRFDLGVAPITLGGEPDNDVVIDDPHVSGRHAEIRPVATGYQLVDLGSTNGTRVQGVAVSSAYLRPGVIVTLGTTHVRFEGPEPDAADGPISFGDAVGRSQVMRQTFALLSRLAPSELTITLLGATGTGKDVLARAIHKKSPRAKGPFVVFDCGAVAPSLIESHLFGHEKGAFTGATDEHPGAFEQADEGTLFLDEVGELALELQPKLLRVLETRRVMRVGGTAERPVDVRIVAATNRDLEREVEAGRFRQDLFYRLGVAVVRLPSLRERPGDVTELIQHMASEMGVAVSPEVIAVLESYDWPGNVRELRNVMMSAVAVSDKKILQPRDLLLFEARRGGASPSAPEAGAEADRTSLAGRTLEQIEAAAIRQTLEHVAGNKTHAAKVLGIAPSTLYAKLKKYSID